MKEALDQHLLWIETNGKEGKRFVYSEYVEETGTNLSGANLSKADLSKANLSEADLSGADLSGANLSKAKLSGANLSGVNLSGAKLSEANLFGADLSKADLSEADLSGADLFGANLSGANLSGAKLSWANLSGANLSWANLSRADLFGANLSGAKLSRADLFGAINIGSHESHKLAIARLVITPEGTLIGWKKCQENVIVKLRIPEKARRSNSYGRKCRAEYVKVLEVFGSEYGISLHDEKTEYRVGKTVKCDNWNEDRFTECGGGIHFYLTREEAEAHS
jgi:hypothetical protein